MNFQPLGKSKFLIGFLAAFLVGIFFGDFIHIDPWWLLGISVGLLFAAAAKMGFTPWKLLILILTLGFFLGLGYFRFWDNRQKSIVLPYSKELEIEGQIIGHPDFSGNKANYVLKIPVSSSRGTAKIRLTAGRYPEYRYGDVLHFKGVIKPSYPYFFHQGILGQVYNPEKVEKVRFNGNIAIKSIYSIRDKFEESLNRNLSEPYASFAAGLVLGSKRNIPDSLMADFNRTGTTHIIAVSGYNVTIIIIYFGLLLGIFSRKLRFWGSIVVILGFVIMTGAPASVVRAGILAGLVAWGQFEGRRINMTILLVLTASLMLLFNPYALKYDISFELSFLAFMGLIYLSSAINNLRFIRNLPNLLKLTFSETMGAQLMVLPILILYFGRVSVVSPIVNILILWLIPTAMLLVFLVGIFGLIWFKLGYILGFVGWFVLKYIIVVVETFSKIPWASYELKTNSWWWLPVYFAIVLLFILRWKNKFP